MTTTKTKIAMTAATVIAGMAITVITVTDQPAEASDQPTEIATATAKPVPAGKKKPIVVEHLCDYNNGEFCEPCTACPQEDSGWLCCTPRGACVSVAIDGDCSGSGNVKGYCTNYSTDAAGNSTCHDAPQ